MALELNKTKLVLFVMLILLNHYINGVKAAEPKTPESGSKAEAPENGSKTHASQVSNSGPKTPESQDSKKNSTTTEAESKESGSKTPESSKESGSSAEAPENGSETPESQVSKSGSKAESPKDGSKTPVSQVSNSGSKTPESSKKSGSSSEPHENGSKTSESQVSNKGSKTAESGSKAEAHENGKSGSKAPALAPGIAGTQLPINGNKTVGTLIPITGNKTGPPQVPCYFIFGDSLVDAGNNNILQTLARADYRPYGIDFKPPGPTGRFCNGKTTVDVMAELLGFDHYIPPSELTFGASILQGLNFASAAAGIREETAQHLGDRVTMKEQVDNFKRKVDEMAVLLGGLENTTDYLGKCLFQVGLGSNDYLNNYFIPNIYPTSKLLTPMKYADELVKEYTTHLMGIYNLGARKIALTGVSQVGCTPNALSQLGNPDGSCVKDINDANEMFNTKLRILVDRLNREHPDAKFTYVNSFGLFQELKEKASTYGLKVTTDGCCGLGKNNGLITCLPGLTPCENRNEYLFWDAYHPSEATNIIGAKRSYKKENPSDAYPYDIHTLLTLK